MRKKEPVIPEPMTENAYENARRLTIREISPKLCGFHMQIQKKRRDIWIILRMDGLEKKESDSIRFEVTASYCCAV